MSTFQNLFDTTLSQEEYNEILNLQRAVGFRPVRTSSDKFNTDICPVRDGYVYFVTDTKKIYLGQSDGNYVPMGGNSGIYYANRPLTAEETAIGQTKLFFNLIEHIEGDQLPITDDLILNISNGGFYRVEESAEIDGLIGVMATQIAISGSSGGGGSGGPGSTKNFTIILKDGKSQYHFVTSDLNNMKFSFQCKNSEADGTNKVVRYTIGPNATQTYIEEDVANQDYIFDVANDNKTDYIEFDVSKIIDKLTNNKSNSLYIFAYDLYDNESVAKVISITPIEMKLTDKISDFVRINLNSDETNYTYSCTPTGGSTLKDKYLHFELFDSKGIKIDEKNIEDIVNTETSYSITFDFLMYENLEHGPYILDAVYCGINPTTGNTEFSNHLYTHIAIWNNDTPIIMTNYSQNVIEQYVAYNLEYFIADSDYDDYTSTSISLLIRQNNEVIETKEYSASLNLVNNLEHTFLVAGLFDLSLKYKDVEYEVGQVRVVAYTGDVPTIGVNEADLNLSAFGRSNNETNKAVWKSSGKSTGYMDFEKVAWNESSGWVIDEENNTALKLSGGAKATLKDFDILKSQSLNSNDKSTSGLLIELDFKLNNVTDYGKSLISCMSYNSNNELYSGFEITGQKAMFNTNAKQASNGTIKGDENVGEEDKEKDDAIQSFTQYYGDNIRVHLAYSLPAVAAKAKPGVNYYFTTTYLNGVISGLAPYTIGEGSNKQNDEKFENANSNSPAELEIDSTYADIYIYNIRVTRADFSHKEIIRRYIADYQDMAVRAELWERNGGKDNNLFNENQKISLTAIKNLSSSFGMPYVLFRGGNEIKKSLKESFSFDAAVAQTNTNNGYYHLPRSKSDYRLMSVKMFDGINHNNPIWEVPVVLTSDSEKENVVFDSSNNDDFNKLSSGTYYIQHGAQVYGQGTSSMVYPIKNLRIKSAHKDDYSTVYEGSQQVEIVCFKADYMDSSSSHNTQTGNLIYDLYAALNMRTPPQAFQDKWVKQYPDLYGGDLVTAIRGFPIICFYSTGNSDNIDTTYEYIGRYNFNLDKATPEPFGFEPQVLKDEQGNIIDSIGYEEDADGNLINIVQCWEFLNNDPISPVKFIPLENQTMDESLKSSWSKYFEDRYPDEIVGELEDVGNEYDLLSDKTKEALEQGLFRLVKWVASTDTERVSGTDLDFPIYYKTLDIECNINKTYYTYNQNNMEYKGYNFNVVPKLAPTIYNPSKTIQHNITSLDIDSEKFVNKVQEIGTYSFTAKTKEDSETVKWYLGGSEMIEDIADYGLTIEYQAGTTEPIEGTQIVIIYSNDYQSTTDSAIYWNKAMYEYHTKDNVDYRLAKFKNEFTQYFDLNYTLFYYILSLVLLMMDSRAKNMMLASWDRTIWYPLFYDMDTMLGVNNVGYNKFSYDTEDINTTAFNAHDSILWINFRDLFKDEIIEFYNRMRTEGGANGLRIDHLLKRYNEKGADAWVESLLTADAIVKYTDPYGNGYYTTTAEGTIKWVEKGTSDYMYAAQGKRSFHRTWWLTNRLKYYDGKYLPYRYATGLKPPDTGTIAFRAYSMPEHNITDEAIACVAQTPANQQFAIKSLNKAYQSLMIGTILWGPELVEAQGVVNLGPEIAKHEVESWILNADTIASLGDLSNKYIGQWNVGVEQLALVDLMFGRSARTHEDKNIWQTYYNNNFQQTTFDLGTRYPLLEKLNMAGYRTLSQLSVSKCSKLKHIDITRCTGLKQLNLPISSVLEELYLPDNLQTLIIEGQPNLNTVVIEDSNGEPAAARFTQLIVDNTNYDVRHLISQSENLTEYRFTNVNWVLNSLDDVEIDGDKITSIKILDQLQKLTPIGVSKTEGLTGTITIDLPGYTANEFEIYSKYIQKFTKLIIKYSDSMKDNVIKGWVINFYNDLPEDYNGTVYYSIIAPSDESKNIGELVYGDQPVTGKSPAKPTRAATSYKTYKFSGYWIGDDKIYYYIDSNEPTEGVKLPDGAVTSTLWDVIPESDLNFYPYFEAIDNQYSITFYNEVADKEYIEYGMVMSPYGQKYTEIEDLTIFDYCESKKIVTLNDNERYAFKGWYNNIDLTGDRVSLDDLIVKGNMKLYAKYEKENVKTKASNEWYFNFDNGVLSIREEYRDLLSGKITVPAKYQGIEITTLGDMRYMSKARELYFQTGNNYTAIGDSAFCVIDNDSLAVELNNSKYMSEGFEGIYLPSSIKTIGNSAFATLITLKWIDEEKQGILPINLQTIGKLAFGKHLHVSLSQYSMQVYIQELPESLEIIGQQAFQSTGSNCFISKIPKNVTLVEDRAFNFHQVGIISIGNTDGLISEQSKIQMESSALNYTNYGMSSSEDQIKSLIFGYNVTPSSFNASNSNPVVNGVAGKDLYAYDSNVSITWYVATWPSADEQIAMYNAVTTLFFNETKNISPNINFTTQDGTKGDKVI